MAQSLIGRCTWKGKLPVCSEALRNAFPVWSPGKEIVPVNIWVGDSNVWFGGDYRKCGNVYHLSTIDKFRYWSESWSQREYIFASRIGYSENKSWAVLPFKSGTLFLLGGWRTIIITNLALMMDYVIAYIVASRISKFHSFSCNPLPASLSLSLSFSDLNFIFPMTKAIIIWLLKKSDRIF